MQRVHELIRAGCVHDLGPLPAPRLSPTATVQQALQLLVRSRRGAIVALEGTRPVGILTERDVLYLLAAGELGSREWRGTTPLETVMSQPPSTIRRQAPLIEALEAMHRLRHRHLVVVDRRGELRGLLTSSDLVQYLTDQFPADTVNLPPRLHQRYRQREGA